MRSLLWKPIVIGLVSVLLLGGCVVVDAAKPKLDNVYDKGIAAWCVLPVATHLRAVQRGKITARSLADNCPAWQAWQDALAGETVWLPTDTPPE